MTRPAFDPDVAAWLAARGADPTAADSSVAGQRLHSEAVNRRATALLPDPPEPVTVREADLAGPGGPLHTLVFEPAAEPLAVVLYCHGGGWIAGSSGTHWQHARRLAAGLPARVVSVDYRLAPEHPFPAAFDDCAAAAADLAGTGLPLVLAGDSAGAQLAASVAIACRDAGIPVAAQLLVVPVADVRGGYADVALDARYPSRVENASGFGLTVTGMATFAELYGPPGDDWRVSPLMADLRGVAPAVVVTAGYDVLRDEGAAYAAALRAAGVPVQHREWPTLNHGFFSLGGVSATADRAADQAVADLRAVVRLAAPPVV